MIQDIFPSKLNIEYKNIDAKDDDYVLIFDKEGKLYVGGDSSEVILTTKADVESQNIIYLFSVDDENYFLCNDNIEIDKDGFSYYTIRELRDRYSGKDIMAMFTAYHLWKWYADNVYCGKCAGKLEEDNKERTLRCSCGNVIYPRINPAVIVGVIKGDSILITRYNRGYAHNALVAGFTEIGETLEETVKREVMEETGVNVKNIRYYKSQPWGMAQDVLVGFYCEADGDCEINMDKDELKYAEWVKRENVVLQPNNLSLTNEMMKAFKENRHND